MPSKKYLPETGKPQVVWLIPQKRRMRGDFSPLLWGKRMVQLVLVILAVCTGFYTAQHQQRSIRKIGDIAIYVPDGEDSPIPTKPDRTGHGPAKFFKIHDKNDIPDAYLSIVKNDGEKASPSPIEPLMTALGLKLIGTLVMDNPEKSVAVIEYSTSRARETVKEGDRAGSVRINKILHDRIIVDDGQSELQIALMTSLPTDNRQPAGQNTSTVALAVAGGTQNSYTPDGAYPINTKRSTGRGGFRHLDRQAVEDSLADLDRIRRQVAIKPAETYGQPAGFRIASIQAGSIFAELGLRNTDVIVGINGATITTPDQADLLYQSLKAGGDVTIQVKGKRRNRIIHLDDIS